WPRPFGEVASGLRGEAQTGHLSEDVAALGEGGQGTHYADHGGQAGTPAAIQAQLPVGGAVPLLAGGGVVVGAPVGDGAVDGADLGGVLDEAGVWWQCR